MPDPLSYQIIIAQTSPHFQLAKELFQAYADELGISLDFQNFADELRELPSQYGLPEGAILLAVSGREECLGCVGLRKFEKGIAELKRMYVAPAGRGKGLGKVLLQEAIRQARTMGYQKLRLDTLPSMKAATHLYRSSGFYAIPPYRFNPIAGTVYLEKDLQVA